VVSSTLPLSSLSLLASTRVSESRCESGKQDAKTAPPSVPVGEGLRLGFWVGRQEAGQLLDRAGQVVEAPVGVTGGQGQEAK
jgi:hypothetical protein